ncbi:hypothetical protein GTO10_05690 [Candidatus Saccharibacteria bacterium]|nr:hypothetical protein [Candidatus Saccharibacteria bacterium]
MKIWKVPIVNYQFASRGYIAFTTVLILSAVILVVGVSLTLLSIFQAQQSLAREKGTQALSLVEGCAQDALLFAYYDADYAGGTKSFPEGSCTTSVSKVGNNWVITSTVTLGGYTKRVRVNILREGEVQILSWKEIE